MLLKIYLTAFSLPQLKEITMGTINNPITIISDRYNVMEFIRALPNYDVAKMTNEGIYCSGELTFTASFGIENKDLFLTMTKTDGTSLIQLVASHDEQNDDLMIKSIEYLGCEGLIYGQEVGMFLSELINQGITEKS